MKMTGGQALARQLALEGVTDVFGVPGAQLDWATDGLAQVADQITFHNTRHEQATTYLADGYARAGGRVGVAMVVPGPGMLNALAGLSTAWACSSPVLLISGQIPSHMIGRGVGMLHEIPRQSEILGSLTTWNELALRPEDVPRLVREAFRELGTGRPRPVGLEIPPDVLSAVGDFELCTPDTDFDGRVKPDPALVEQVAAAIASASRPVIMAGWGVSGANASAELVRLAEAIGAPVVTSLNGRGTISDRHPLAVMPTAGVEILADADLVIGIGTRFMLLSGDPVQVPPGAKVVLINADPADLGAPRPVDIAIHGDAGLTAAAITDACGRLNTDNSAVERVAAARARAQARYDVVQPQAEYAAVLRQEIPDNGVLINELTQVGYFSNAAYPVYGPRTFITPGYQGTLGYGFPTGLGAKVALPDVPVVSISGDGGFGWNLQELATARRFNIGLVTVIFADGQFTNVKRLQQSKFEGRVIGSDLTNPDFVALAESFGVTGRRANSPQSLAPVLRESIQANEPTLIEVTVGQMSDPWPLLPTAPRPL
jgi:acetolactate synthase-1/2/3 large subunit